jgi:sec-independent protein translocase protein TatB
MFDFAWTEIALIGVVALVAIGPKDMPVAIRTVTSAIKKARRMAAEFQTHVDDMVRDADLQEVRNSISEIRNFDFKGTVERAVDPDGSLRATLATNPLAPDPLAPDPVIGAPAPAASPMTSETAVAELDRPPPPVPHLASEPEPRPDEVADAEPAPWFIPPAFAAKPEAAPAFVPPTAKRPPRS